MRKIILLAFLILSVSSQAQLGNLLSKGTGGKSGKLKLFKEEKIDVPQYKNHVGEVCFSSEVFELTIPESKYIKTYKLGDPLFIRGFFANSPVNGAMLALEESGLKPQEINQAKDELKQKLELDYRLFLDGKQITRSSAGEPEDMVSVLTYAANLNDNTNSRVFGKDLYIDLLKKKDLLIPGTHKLKIEVYPSVGGYGTGSHVEYKAIAVGEIDIVIAEPKASAETCFPYKAMSDPALEAEVLKSVKKNRPNAFKVILNSQITIIRDEYKQIVSKTFNATVVSKTVEKVSYDVFRFDKMFDGTGYMTAVISKDMENALLPKNYYVNKECLKFLK